MDGGYPRNCNGHHLISKEGGVGVIGVAQYYAFRQLRYIDIFDKYRYFKNIDGRYSIFRISKISKVATINNLISDYSAIIVFSNYCFHRCMKFRQHAYGDNCEFMIQVCGQLKLKAKTEKLWPQKITKKRHWRLKTIVLWWLINMEFAIIWMLMMRVSTQV